MKHIIKYSDHINESIGIGSIILIKGKPNRDDKRNLYVTTISGYKEIKPGAIMVFLGNQIWRVKHNGYGKFSGVKVYIKDDAGLRDVLNMKSGGVPSVVLNHNKTPFHWLTLKHIDIGKALREVERLLPGNNLILESDSNEREEIRQKNWVIFQNWAIKEFFKAVFGADSAIVIDKIVSKSSYPDDEDLIEDPNAIVDFYYEVYLKNDKIPKDLINFTKEEDLYDTLSDEFKDDFLDLINVKHKTFDIDVYFELNFDVDHEFDSGDYETPPYSKTDVDLNLCKLDDIIIAGSGVTQFDEGLIDDINNKIKNLDPFDFMPIPGK